VGVPGVGGKGEAREDAEDDGADAESRAPAMGAVSTRGEPSKDDAARTGCERYRNMISRVDRPLDYPWEPIL
jgi:hypothetical protein